MGWFLNNNKQVSDIITKIKEKNWKHFMKQLLSLVEL